MDAGGISNNNSARGDIACDDGAGANGSTFADCQPWQNRRIRPDRGAPADDREQRLEARLLGARVKVIGESSIRTDTDIILKRYSVPELDAAFDGDAVANGDLVFNEAV